MSGDFSYPISAILRGDSTVTTQFVDEYFPVLIQIAKKSLFGIDLRVVNEEDIVQSAFRRFFNRAQDNQFTEIKTNGELVALLKKITRDRAIDLIRHQRTLKNGRGKVKGESGLIARFGEKGSGEVEDTRGAMALEEALNLEFESLLNQLEDSELQRIALLRFEGYGNKEIADELDCSLRSVERRLQLIRRIWEEQSPSE